MKNNLGVLKEVFGLWHSDDRGYATGEAVGFFPFAAAAEMCGNQLNMGGYRCVNREKVVVFDDGLIYRVASVIPTSKIVGEMAKFVPVLVFEDYKYNNGTDNTKYHVGNDRLLNLFVDGERHNVKTVHVVLDNETAYVLASPKPITLTPFAMSREMAVRAALDKLTPEEKGLLGLE